MRHNIAGFHKPLQHALLERRQHIPIGGVIDKIARPHAGSVCRFVEFVLLIRSALHICAARYGTLLLSCVPALRTSAGANAASKGTPDCHCSPVPYTGSPRAFVRPHRRRHRGGCRFRRRAREAGSDRNGHTLPRFRLARTLSPESRSAPPAHRTRAAPPAFPQVVSPAAERGVRQS